jgi:SAM domain (Sterile alpha motif)
VLFDFFSPLHFACSGFPSFSELRSRFFLVFFHRSRIAEEKKQKNKQNYLNSIVTRKMSAEMISVEEILVKADLVKYVPTFAEEEIDSVELLSALSVDELKELGLTLGARKRLQTTLATLSKDSKTPKTLETSQVAQDSKDGSNAMAASSSCSSSSSSEQWRERLSKLLSWMLRFGLVPQSSLEPGRCKRMPKRRVARKALNVTLYRGGYVLLRELAALAQLASEPLEQVLAALRTSRSPDGLTKRFETCRIYGNLFVRATYGHGFDVDAIGGASPNTAPKDEESERRWSVRSLAEQCWDVIVAAVRSDAAAVLDSMPPDVMPLLVERLKQANRLNNAALRALLTPKLRVVDLSNVYIGGGSLRRVANCTDASALLLSGCGVDVTDQLLSFLLKRIGRSLRTLAIANLKYVGNAALEAVARHCGLLESLDIAQLARVTDAALAELVERCPALTDLATSNGNLMITPHGVKQLEATYPRLTVHRRHVAVVAEQP